jgi:uncharacterized protein YozE (UPF0346 family)
VPKRKPRTPQPFEYVEPNVVKIKPRRRYVKWPPTFHQFLAYHRNVHGPLGKLARFVMTDKCFPPRTVNKRCVSQHLLRHAGERPDMPGDFEVHEAFRLYYEFVAAKRQIPARTAPTRDYYQLRYTTFSPEAWRMLNELCNPQRRPTVITSRPAVIEEAVRFLYEHTFGKPRQAAKRAMRMSERPRDAHLDASA